jgi:hypothetical protein
MAIAQELLDHAQAVLDSTRPSEAALRRASSTAYYALFHLLIGEATANWARSQWRPLLGRVFEHGKMKGACSSVPGVNAKPQGKLPKIPFVQRTSTDHLRIVAETFILAQECRELADYETSSTWKLSDAAVQVERVADAFRSWKVISTEPEAQQLLVLMLGPKQRASRA